MVEVSSPFRTMDRFKVYASIVDEILERIRSGEFAPGSALPAERILAEQLSVSRGSLREAIRVLEHAGLLDVRVGSGTYVSAGSRSKAALLRARAAAMGDDSPLDLLVARRAVEPTAARLAAAHRQPGDLEEMRRALDDQVQATRRGEDPSEPDFAFHLAIAHASHNHALVLLMRTLIELMHQGTWAEYKTRTRAHAGGAQRFVDDHADIVEAIERGDADGAERAMSAHLDAVEARLLAEVE